jgi:DMSO/TMAO reductase YedYZ molybdopterin-dependent catalytic subunit
MRQPETGARETGGGWPGASATSAPEAGSETAAAVLPPGQHIPRKLPVLHYGPVPAFRPHRWDLRVSGATESGGEHIWSWDDVCALPRSEVTADLHCVTRFTIPGNHWAGIAAAEVLRAAPPAGSVTHVMIWADYGYSANIRIADFARARLPAAPGGALAVCVEERQVGAGHRVPDPGPARLLGGARLSQHRRPLA